MGPMPYGFTWLLMPLKVLRNLPKPLRILILKSHGKREQSQ